MKWYRLIKALLGKFVLIFFVSCSLPLSFFPLLFDLLQQIPLVFKFSRLFLLVNQNTKKKQNDINVCVC